MDKEKALLAFQKQKNRHLIISILLDLLGMSTYLLPVMGELGDTIFAPFYGIAIFVMYRKALIPAALGGFAGALEEFLPASDIIPTATVMWVYYYIVRNKKALNQFADDRADSLKSLD